jgi:hypothetical protein
VIALSRNSGTAFVSKVSDPKKRKQRGYKRIICCDLRANEYDGPRDTVFRKGKGSGFHLQKSRDERAHQRAASRAMRAIRGCRFLGAGGRVGLGAAVGAGGDDVPDRALPRARSTRPDSQQVSLRCSGAGFFNMQCPSRLTNVQAEQRLSLLHALIHSDAFFR